LRIEQDGSSNGGMAHGGAGIVSGFDFVPRPNAAAMETLAVVAACYGVLDWLGLYIAKAPDLFVATEMWQVGL
jgi:hypothetical protein